MVDLFSVQKVIEQLYDLDENIFALYVKRKSESVTGIMEEGMKAGFFDWEHCTVPTTVRNYVKEVLFNLVIIHAEVSKFSESFLLNHYPRLCLFYFCRYMQFRLELWSEFFFDWWSYSQPSSSN